MSGQFALALIGGSILCFVTGNAGLGALFFLAFLLYAASCSFRIISEKQQVIIERFGKYTRTLNPGPQFIVPFIDQPKTYTFRYFVSNMMTGSQDLVHKKGESTISTQAEVIDFPKQNVITRDNASLHLDAVLSFKIVNPKVMIYSCRNLPLILSKLLQAQMRNVAGALSVDQIIGEPACLDVITGMMEQNVCRWGVTIQFVKIQRVDAGGLKDVLSKKNTADLQNKEIIIQARAAKQTSVIESEGQRDRMMKEAEGNAQQLLSRARGVAQAIVNAAGAEAESVKEIARALHKLGEDPAAYLLSLKYVDALKKIMEESNTSAEFLPHATSFMQTVSDLGFNTIMPNK